MTLHYTTLTTYYVYTRFCYTTLITQHYISLHESFQHICQRTAMRSSCANGTEFGCLYSIAEFLFFVIRERCVWTWSCHLSIWKSLCRDVLWFSARVGLGSFRGRSQLCAELESRCKSRKKGMSHSNRLFQETHIFPVNPISDIPTIGGLIASFLITWYRHWSPYDDL